MAKTRKQMKGWQYILDEDINEEASKKVSDSLPKRSLRNSRRSHRKDPEIVLRRDNDNLEVKMGDILLVNDDESADEQGEEEDLPSIGFVKDIAFGTDSFLDVRVLWFYRISEVDEDKLPEGRKSYNDNDTFLCPVMDKITLSDILTKCTVISDATLKKTVIDESNQDTTFVCRRFCDSDAEYFTDVIDWDEMFKCFQDNHEDFYKLVKNLTVRPTVKGFAKKLFKRGIDPRSLKAEEKKLKRKKKRQQQKNTKKLDYAENDDDDDDDDIYDDDDFYVYDFEEKSEDSQAELEDEDSGEEYVDRKFRSSPRKKKTRAAGRPRKRTRSVKNVNTPKKRLKPRLPRVARKFQFNEDAKELDIDSLWEANADSETSKALRRAKKVLHTSAKLHSLPCREEEFSRLFYTLESAVQSQIGRCIYVSGTPGVGKTATIREVIKQLATSFIAETKQKMFNYVEINGLKLISPQSSYEVLWEKVSGKHATTSNSLVLLEEYFNKEDSKRKPLVVLLDEMDQIVTKNQSVMYNFFNWPSYQNSKLIVIAVANTMDLPERMLTNKISSRLGLTRIQFSSYTYTQLSKIIKKRLEKLGRLNKERMVISKDAIAFASRKVASVSGDARRALMICIRAVEIAETEFMVKSKEEKKKLDGKYTVTIMHIMKAVNEIASSPISNYLSALPFMSKMFLASMLLRMRRSGVAEVFVGDVIDELNNQFHVMLFTDLRKRLDPEQLDLLDVIYGVRGKSQIRPRGLDFIMMDLEENGILIVQQTRLERSRLLRLNVSQDEILNGFRKDDLIREVIASR